MLMPRRQLVVEDFIGKRIIEVDASAVNFWVFHFDDGSRVGVETDSFGYGLAGLVLSEPTSTNSQITASASCSDSPASGTS